MSDDAVLAVILVLFYSERALKEKNGQKSNHKLQQELASSKQECERLQEELQQVLLQLDASVRSDMHTANLSIMK